MLFKAMEGDVKVRKSSIEMNCILCNRLIALPKGIYNEAMYREPESEERLFASFKFIDADLTEISNVWKELTQSQSGSSVNIAPSYTIYCQTCKGRNESVFKIMREFEELQQKVEGIKEDIIEDFKNSINKKLEMCAANKDDGIETHQKQVQLLRSCISEGLQIFPTEDNLTDDYDDFVPCFDNFDSMSDHEDVMEPPVDLVEAPEHFVKTPADLMKAPNSLVEAPDSLVEVPDSLVEVPDSLVEAPVEYEQDLMRKYGIKDLTVVIKKLSAEKIDKLIRKGAYAKNSRSRKKMDVIKCLFEDCQSPSYATDTDIRGHLMTKHQFSAKEIDEILNIMETASEVNAIPAAAVTKAAKNDGGSRLHCSFVSCDFMTESDDFDEVKRHLEVVHMTLVTDSEDDVEISTYRRRAITGRCIFSDCKSVGFQHTSQIVAHARRQHGIEVTEADIHSFVAANPIRKNKCTVITCPFKGKMFTDNERKRHHRKYHVPVPPTSFVCTTCGKAFRFKSALLRHHNVHIGEKKFSCSQCDKKYRDEGGLRGHLRNYHNEVNTPRYVCPFCGKGIVNHSNYKNHIMSFHKQSQETFICELCGRSFVTLSYLKKHYRCKHKIRPNNSRNGPIVSNLTLA